MGLEREERTIHLRLKEAKVLEVEDIRCSRTHRIISQDEEVRENCTLPS